MALDGSHFSELTILERQLSGLALLCGERQRLD
jgi:hypothetical protein